MKKNKTIAYMLAATLLVGGTFVGTKAWFTDKVDAKNDLVITTGTLDVEFKGDWCEEWGVISTNEEAEKVGDNVYKNVKPGDGFTKGVAITNKGNLSTKLSVEGGQVKEGKEDMPFTIEYQGLNDLNGKILKPNETVYFQINGTFNKDLDNTYQNKEISLNEYLEDITINANQINYKLNQ